MRRRALASDDEVIGTCASCGRAMEARRRWRGREQQVRYCSQRCRRNRPSRVDRALEAAIERLLSERSSTATICPSEAARAVAPAGWQALMERTRSAARRLVAAGRIIMLQRGRPVDPSTARGPVRLKARRDR